jgi:phosphatidylglycerol lysyltransferase
MDAGRPEEFTGAHGVPAGRIPAAAVPSVVPNRAVASRVLRHGRPLRINPPGKRPTGPMQGTRDERSLLQSAESGRPAVLDESSEAFRDFVVAHGQYFDSYLATEPGRLRFWSRDCSGLISYTRRGRYVLVGGGLIAPESRKANLLGEFVEFGEREGLRLGFHNIGETDLPLFSEFGFQITKWGEEPVIDLGDRTWAGKQFEWVRRQSNYCRRQGLVAYEIHPDRLARDQWSRTIAEVREVAAASLARKIQSNGMSFFEGNIDHHELGRRRLFVARADGGLGRIEGFVVCNPMYNGKCWSTELYRHRPDSVRGTIAFLFHHLIDAMQTEGVGQVTLCLDPGRNSSTPRPGDSWQVRRLLEFNEKYLSAVFDVAGLRHFKGRFRPRFENLFVCSRPDVSIGSLWAFVNVLGSFQVDFRKLARVIADRVRKRHSRKTLAGTESAAESAD